MAHSDTDARLKKSIVRSLIHEVVVDDDSASGEIVLVIHGEGGLHTELRVPRRWRGKKGAHTPTETLQGVRASTRVCPGAYIVNGLNRNGLRIERGNFWAPKRVTALRSHHAIPIYSEEQGTREGWLNLTEAARSLGISARTLRLAVERGELKASIPCSTTGGSSIATCSSPGPPARSLRGCALSHRSGNAVRTRQPRSINDIAGWGNMKEGCITCNTVIAARAITRGSNSNLTIIYTKSCRRR